MGDAGVMLMRVVNRQVRQIWQVRALNVQLTIDSNDKQGVYYSSNLKC